MNPGIIGLPALALTLGAAMSFAQTPAAPQQNPQTSPPPTHAPPTPQRSQNPANPANPASPPHPVAPMNPPDPANPVNQGQRPATPMPQSKPFQLLDLERKGTLTKLQASADPWLNQNFVTCDANSNNEVTESEYATCTRAR